MAYDRGSLLHDVQQRLKMGKDGYAEFKNGAGTLTKDPWPGVVNGDCQHGAHFLVHNGLNSLL